MLPETWDFDLFEIAEQVEDCKCTRPNKIWHRYCSVVELPNNKKRKMPLESNVDEKGITSSRVCKYSSDPVRLDKVRCFWSELRFGIALLKMADMLQLQPLWCKFFDLMYLLIIPDLEHHVLPLVTRVDFFDAMVDVLVENQLNDSIGQLLLQVHKKNIFFRMRGCWRQCVNRFIRMTMATRWIFVTM